MLALTLRLNHITTILNASSRLLPTIVSQRCTSTALALELMHNAQP
jgi:hypothetical protein